MTVGKLSCLAYNADYNDYSVPVRCAGAFEILLATFGMHIGGSCSVGVWVCVMIC